MQETFPERLRRLLDEKHFGKPLKTMAEEAGVDQATLKAALSGEKEPRFKTAQKLAAYVGVSYEYLMTGEGQPDPPPVDVDDISARVNEAMALLQSIARDLDARDSTP